MSRRRNHPATQRELEQRLHDAMKAHGWLVPTTPDEVAQAENKLWKIAPTADISEPPPFHQIASPSSRGGLSMPENKDEAIDIEETLARAARAGKDLLPEIEEAMHRDRDAAEAEADMKEQNRGMK